MTNIDRHPLSKLAYDTIRAIEMCDASPAETAAVIKAGELMTAIDKHLDIVDKLKQRDADLIGQQLNNARMIARSIQGFVEEARWEDGVMKILDQFKNITDAAVRIEALLAEVVSALRSS